MAAAPGLFVRRSPRGSAGQGSAESRLRAPGWQSGRRLDVANAPQAGFDNPSAATGASVVKRGSFTSRRLSAPSTSLPLKPASIESSRSNGILRRASLPTPGSKPLRRPAPGEETAALSVPTPSLAQEPGTAVTSLLGYRERRKQRHGPTVADEPPLQAELAKDLPEIGELRVEAEESGNIAEEWHDQQLSVPPFAHAGDAEDPEAIKPVQLFNISADTPSKPGNFHFSPAPVLNNDLQLQLQGAAESLQDAARALLRLGKVQALAPAVQHAGDEASLTLAGAGSSQQQSEGAPEASLEEQNKVLRTQLAQAHQRIEILEEERADRKSVV